MKLRAILLSIMALPLLSTCELLPIRTYTTADGLAADSVYGIFADSSGFLWFSTMEGISRFDGYRFITFGVEDGLPHGVISAMTETRAGEHWIGTPRGLSRIATSGAIDRFKKYRIGPDAASNNVGTLLELRSGSLLAATAGGLFGWTTPGGFQLQKLYGIDPQSITDMVEDSAGNVWIGCTTGIYVWGPGGIVQRFSTKNGLPGDWAQSLLFDSKGRLWAALRGGLAMIGRAPLGNWRVEQVYGPHSALSGMDVRALHEASDGTLWVGTGLGLSRLSWPHGSEPVIENLTRDQGLSDREILSLGEDQAGNIWVGTEGAGVMRIDRLGFRTYREQDGLATDRVFSVFGDRAGQILTVTSGAGSKSTHSLDIFDGVRFHSVSLGKFTESPSWGWDRVLLESRTGEWWGATDHGLCRYGSIKAEQLNRREPRACYTDDTVFRVFEDSKGGIWFSGQSKPGNRIRRWDPRTNQVFTFPVPIIPGGRTDELVSSFAEDPQGNVWMGLWVGGVYRFDGHGFRYFQKSDRLPGGPVLALLAEGSRLWVGAGAGLARIEDTTAENLTLETYNTARGMASNNILCLVADLEGRIYAGTGKGVDRLEPGTGHIRHFSSANGLAHGSFKSAFRGRDGSLWFATTQGLSRLVPTKDPPPVSPRVLLTDVRIGGDSYPVSQAGEARLSRLELKPSANQLQVDFVATDYEPGDILRYSYKLEGADSGWSPPRSQHAVNYAALAPGTYHFLVKAVTSEGGESLVPAQLDFIVLPPVWRRWWFEAVALALVGAAVFGAHWYRVAQAVSVERIRTAIATDLHDDIGASLAQIAILSEVARVNADGAGRPGEPLERVAILAREVVDSMGDIVWSIRSEPDGMETLVRRMREFALDLLSFQGIDFELRGPEIGKHLELGLQARRQVFLIFKECIHNAARHSRCSAVVAELKLANGEVVMTIEDNGTGLRLADKATGGTGISNIERRSQALAGRMQLDSKPGEGCCVTVRFPIYRSALIRAKR